jgi:hypothetical protein
VFAAVLAGCVAYTIFSEWLNTAVRQGWAYSPLMPEPSLDQDLTLKV